MKVVKNLMSKDVEDHQDPFLALLDWRNTLSEATQLSQAQMMFGRRNRTLMSTSDSLLPSSSRIRKRCQAKASNILQRICQGKTLTK